MSTQEKQPDIGRWAEHDPIPESLRYLPEELLNPDSNETQALYKGDVSGWRLFMTFQDGRARIIYYDRGEIPGFLEGDEKGFYAYLTPSYQSPNGNRPKPINQVLKSFEKASEHFERRLAKQNKNAPRIGSKVVKTTTMRAA